MRSASAVRPASRPLAGAIVALLAASGLPAQTVTTVPDAVRCAACDLELRRVAVLGTADGPAALAGEPSAVRRDGSGRYFMTQFVVFNEVLVFDRSGHHLVTLGRQGAGPGEFRWVSTVAVHADSVFAFDAGNVRISVFAPDLSPARTERLPGGMTYGAVVLRGGEVVTNSNFLTSDGMGLPLHLLGAGTGPAPDPLSFGAADGQVQLSASPIPMMRALTPTRDGGGVWAAPRTRYVLERWSTGGELTHRVVRQASWFPPDVERPALPQPPPPFLYAIREIAPARIMTLTGVPKADFGRRLGPPVRRSERGTPIYDLSRPQDLRDTIVEVIDVASGRVLLSRRVDGYIFGFADQDHVYGYRLDDDDIPRVDVFRFRFTER